MQVYSMTFSVKLLLGAIALAAVMFSAITGANEKSLRLIGTTTFLLSILATVVAIFGSSKSRVFAAGFLIGCLPYVYLAIGNHGWRRYLATEVALEVLDKDLRLSEPRKTPAGETIQVLSNGLVSVSTPRGFGRTRTLTMSWEAAKGLGYLPYAYKEDLIPKKLTFLLIGHFVVALLLGIAAGSLAVFVNRPRQTSEAQVS